MEQWTYSSGCLPRCLPLSRLLPSSLSLAVTGKGPVVSGRLTFFDFASRTRILIERQSVSWASVSVIVTTCSLWLIATTNGLSRRLPCCEQLTCPVKLGFDGNLQQFRVCRVGRVGRRQKSPPVSLVRRDHSLRSGVRCHIRRGPAGEPRMAEDLWPVHDDNAITTIAIEVMILADLTCLFRFGARATVPCTCLYFPHLRRISSQAATRAYLRRSRAHR